MVTLLTDFTEENGGTAILPSSHINPRYPDNREEFLSRAIQVKEEAGDVLMFSGPIQHCAMPNKSQMISSSAIGFDRQPLSVLLFLLIILIYLT